MAVDFVQEVRADEVIVRRRGRRQRIAYRDERELASLLTLLRDEGLPFVQHTAGWEPEDEFADLRTRGLISGVYDTISWSGPGEAVVVAGR